MTIFSRKINRQKLTSYVIIFIYWFLNINLMAIFIFITLETFVDAAEINKDNLTNSLARYMVSWESFLEGLFFPAFMTALFIFINEYAERNQWDRYSFGKIIFFKSIMYLVGLMIISLLMYGIVVSLGFVDPYYYKTVTHETSTLIIGIVSSSIYLIFQVIILNFIIQTTKNVGGNNLVLFVTGKYHKPKMEEKLFLFLDLKSSTSYAEKLGSIKYSNMIKDCFQEMNFLVHKYEADIYQYVGDEIVLTWDLKDGLKNSNFIHIFFEFKHTLQSRKDYYIDKYGLIPEFKAGANGGKITVNEVGNIRRDIAYHGDVINTASRIQSICNQYKEKFLVSSKLIKKLDQLNGYESTSIGDIQLRGKEKSVEVFAVNEASN